MKKRNLYGEIAEGLNAMSKVRAGKHTVRAHEAEFRPTPDVIVDEPLALHERLSSSMPIGPGAGQIACDTCGVVAKL